LIEQGSDRWSELVRECITARLWADVAKRNWAIGDIALKIAPDGRHSASALRAFADEVGVGYASLCNYRRTSEAWPSATRDVEGVAWTVYQDLASRPHLMRPHLGSQEARAMILAEDSGVTVEWCGVPTSGERGHAWLIRRVKEGLENLTDPATALSSNQRKRLVRMLADSLVRLSAN
jgi:hypothetical protein